MSYADPNENSLKDRYQPSEAVVVFSEAMRRVSLPVTEFNDDLKRLVDAMWDIVELYKGVGLAAVQVAVFRRVAVLHPKPSPIRLVMVNPVILERSKETVPQYEACLSLPGVRVFGTVHRAEKLLVEYYDLEGEKHRLECDGPMARIVQHEVDHMDGKFYIDYLGNLARKMCLWKVERHLQELHKGAKFFEESAWRKRLMERAFRRAQEEEFSRNRSKAALESKSTGELSVTPEIPTE